MSIEAMKRIKSLLQDGDKIDSHTISAVVAECDAAILTQQPDNAACKSVQKRLEAQQPATPEPVKSFAELREKHRAGIDAERAKLDATSVPEFSRIAKRKLDELQKQGFTITGYAIQCGTHRGFITNGGFVGWWRSDEAPSVPDAAIDSAIYNQCPDFDDWHEGPSIDDIRAIVRAAMLAAK